MWQHVSREFWWAIHNLLAHPLSQLVWFVSLFGYIKPLRAFSVWIHDVTVPTDGHV